MSGGHFDYSQYAIDRIADEVEQLILLNDSEEVDQWGWRKGRGYSAETIDQFKAGLRVLRRAAIYAQRIDWLVSNDDSEDSFHQRLNTELISLLCTKEQP